MRITNFFSLLKKSAIFKFWYFYNTNFNQTVKNQNKDYKAIPIIIVNFNQLENLKKLISFLKKRNYKNIVIIDNLSTYPPLLEYYKNLKDVIVERNKRNDGHRVFWSKGNYFSTYGKGYYVVTDPDVIPLENCPGDFLRYFKQKLDKNIDVTKVGFNLKLDDLPNHNINKQKVISWEGKFWKEEDEEGDYVADIDTTFALYRPKQTFFKNNFYRAIRTKEPYSARHLGWYIDNENLSEEEDFYMKTANSSSSWRVDKDGDLLEKHYDGK